MVVFNQQLVERITAYYKSKGIILTPDLAEEYLNQMADLYESFMVFAQKYHETH